MSKVFFILALIYGSCEHSRDSIERILLMYENNKVDFEKALELFKKEKEVLSLRRLEKNDSFHFFRESSVWLVYNLVLNDGKDNLTILIDTTYKGRESQFWEKNNYQVESTNGMSLIAFLDSNNVALESFKTLKHFLTNNNLLMISREIDSEKITIMLNENEGYLYNPGDSFPHYVEANEIRKIDDKIYYFKQRP